MAAERPVAVVEAAGEVPVDLRAQAPERADQDRGGAHPVHVVVPVDRDARAALRRGQDQRRRPRSGRGSPAGRVLLGRQRSGAPPRASPRPRRASTAATVWRQPERALESQRAGHRIGCARPPRRTRVHPRHSGAVPDGTARGDARLAAGPRGASRSRVNPWSTPAARSPREPPEDERPSPISAPGMASSAGSRCVSSAPGTWTPFTMNPNSDEPAIAARNAPTIPPQKRSGRNTVKCQTARPIITQTRIPTATAFRASCGGCRAWLPGLGRSAPGCWAPRTRAGFAAAVRRPAGASGIGARPSGACSVAGGSTGLVLVARSRSCSSDSAGRGGTAVGSLRRRSARGAAPGRPGARRARRPSAGVPPTVALASARARGRRTRRRGPP